MPEFTFEPDTNRLTLKDLSRFAAGLALAASIAEDTSMREACSVAGLDYETLLPLLPKLAELGREDAGEPASEYGSHEGWLADLLTETIGGGDPSTWQPRLLHARIERLLNCTLSIPDFNAYDALIRTRSGRKPQKPRPGRPDDESCPRSDRTDAQYLTDALDFLRMPSRAAYIRSGRTDLVPALSCEVLNYLTTVHVLVRDDLRRLDDYNLMRLPGVTPAVVAAVYRLKYENADPFC